MKPFRTLLIPFALMPTQLWANADCAAQPTRACVLEMVEAAADRTEYQRIGFRLRLGVADLRYPPGSDAHREHVIARVRDYARTVGDEGRVLSTLRSLSCRHNQQSKLTPATLMLLDDYRLPREASLTDSLGDVRGGNSLWKAGVRCGRTPSSGEALLALAEEAETFERRDNLRVQAAMAFLEEGVSVSEVRARFEPIVSDYVMERVDDAIAFWLRRNGSLDEVLTHIRSLPSLRSQIDQQSLLVPRYWEENRLDDALDVLKFVSGMLPDTGQREDIRRRERTARLFVQTQALGGDRLATLSGLTRLKQAFDVTEAFENDVLAALSTTLGDTERAADILHPMEDALLYISAFRHAVSLAYQSDATFDATPFDRDGLLPAKRTILFAKLQVQMAKGDVPSVIETLADLASIVEDFDPSREVEAFLLEHGQIEYLLRGAPGQSPTSGETLFAIAASLPASD